MLQGEWGGGGGGSLVLFCLSLSRCWEKGRGGEVGPATVQQQVSSTVCWKPSSFASDRYPAVCKDKLQGQEVSKVLVSHHHPFALTPTELQGTLTTFHCGVVNTVLTTRLATRRCLIHICLVFSLLLSFLTPDLIGSAAIAHFRCEKGHSVFII